MTRHGELLTEKTNLPIILAAASLVDATALDDRTLTKRDFQLTLWRWSPVD